MTGITLMVVHNLPWYCSFCGKHFKSGWEVEAHKEEEHKDEQEKIVRIRN